MESVLCKNIATVEIVVVDDGSTDATNTVLSTFGERISVIRQANKGAAAARNVAFKLTRGKYVTILDADDRLVPGGIDHLLQALQENSNVGLAYGDCQKMNEMGILTERINLRVHLTPADDPLRALAIRNIFPVNAAVVRRCDLTAVGDLHDEREDLIGDWDLWARVACRTRFQYCPGIVAHYRQHTAMSILNISRRKGMMQTANTLERIARSEAFSRLPVLVRWASLFTLIKYLSACGEWERINSVLALLKQSKICVGPVGLAGNFARSKGKGIAALKRWVKQAGRGNP